MCAKVAAEQSSTGRKGWFRLYSEIIRDPKIRRLPPDQRWLWVTILCLANDSPERGRLLISQGLPYTVEDITDAAGMDQETVEEALQKFESWNMVERDGEVLVVVHWDDRQYDYPSDKPEATRERKRRSRDNRKGHDNVTSESRGGHDTDTDTDYTDTDVTPPVSPPPGDSDGEENTDGDQKATLDRLVRLFNDLDPPPKGQLPAFSARRREELALAIRAGVPPDILEPTIKELAPQGAAPWDVRKEAVKRHASRASPGRGVSPEILRIIAESEDEDRKAMRRVGAL